MEQPWINKIVCDDAERVLRLALPKNCVDLTVTSPPYGDLRDYKGYNFDYVAILKGLYRVTKPGGVVVWVVGDKTTNGSESGMSFKQALTAKEIGFRLHDTMIYEKTGFSFPSKVRYHQVFEYMFIFSKGKPKTFNPIMDRKNKWGSSWGNSSHRQKDGSLEQRGVVSYDEYGMRWNIWRITNGAGFGQSDKRAYEHPATFPEQLAHDHILSWSNEGDLVLDPMCGSGTTLRMAKLLGRNYIGIDIAEDYVSLSRKLLQDSSST